METNPLIFKTIAQIMSKDEAQIYQLLHGLIEKGIISLTSVVDDQGRNSDQYSLDPLYKKTLKLLRDQTQATPNSSSSANAQ